MFVVLILVQLAVTVAGILLLASLAGRARRAAVLWLMAVAMRRGLPLAEELEAFSGTLLHGDAGHARQIAGRLRAGESLSQALTAQPGLLPPEAEVMVHVGTRTNQLPAALSDAATRQIRMPAVVDIGGSPALTAFYLTAVPTVMLLILSGLMYFIVPKYRMIFEDFGVQMPPVSEWLIDASAIFADAASFLCVIAVIVPILASIWTLIRLSRGKPVAPFNPYRDPPRVPTFLRGLALAADAQRPLTEALEALAVAYRSSGARRQFNRTLTQVRAGTSIWRASEEVGLLRGNDARLLAAAERVGNLPWALRFLADRRDSRRRRAIAVAFEVFQPLLVIGLGCVVFFVFIGMFMPLIKLIDDLSKW